MDLKNVTDHLFWYKAMVERVVDGDTIDVKLDLGFSIYMSTRLRLYGIDTPEVYGANRTAAGTVASNRVKELLPVGSTVWVNSIKDSQEKYGRYLGIIYTINGTVLTNLNDLLVSEGLAVKASY